MLGRLSDVEAGPLEDHITVCTCCVETIETMTAEDVLVEAMRAVTAARVELPTGPTIERLIEQANSLEFSAKVEATGIENCDFLAPAEGPGEIGRLGHYRVLSVLGSGGMGIVFEAEDPQLQRRVALKCMKPALAVSPTARRRFLREARAMAAVSHDHIVAIHQVGEDRGIPFLAMPLLTGETLEARLQRLKERDMVGLLPIAEVLRIGRETAEGLAAAHQQGLIHRDIKPGNLWLEAGGDRVKILDFGLARPAQDDEPLTQIGAVAGTPQYMAPEQAAAKEVDSRCDLFSLGCVLYRLTTGQAPFSGSDLIALLAALTQEPPQAPRKLNPQVPPALSGLIMTLLAKDPAKRMDSAQAVAEAIRRIERESWTAPSARRRWLPIGLAAAALLLGVTAWLFGPTLYCFATNQGELVIESPTADAVIILKQDGEEIAVLDLKTQRRLILHTGQYEIELADGEDRLRLSADRVVLTRGRKEVLEIRSAPRAAAQVTATKHPDELRCFEDPSMTVRCVAFSPDGKFVLAGCRDGSLRLWDTESGTEVRRFEGHTQVIWSVAFSRDGRRILSGGGDSTVRLWEVDTGKELRRFKHTTNVKTVAFAPDGKRALSGTDRLGPRMAARVYLWDLESGREVRHLAMLRHHDIWCVNYSTDGDRFLATDGNLVRVFDAEGKKELGRLTGHEEEVRSAVFSADGRNILTGSHDRSLRLWDASTMTELRKFLGHTDKVLSVTFTPDGRRALSCGLDQTVRLWDMATGRELRRFTGHVWSVNGVAVSSDGGRAASGSSDTTVRLWQLPSTDAAK
jgi:eukaryotic-like serine/threonine-protein kinase